MGLVIAAAVVVVAAAAVIAVAMRRRRSVPEPDFVEEAARDQPPPTPMTGLESALDQATDRSGRPLRDRLDDEPVDDLRVPDDTGPLLRRALDHVGQLPDEHDPAAESAAADEQADDADDG